jgi:Carboxypeptidase regulatory-like domain
LSQKILRFSQIALFGALLLVAGAAQAATITGTVRNATSGKPAAGVDVILIQLQDGMKSVASTKTDAQGKYTLESPPAGRDAAPMPMLIRAVYRGVMFHQPLPPGQTTADVTIYDPTSDPKTVKIGTRVMMFQPNGENLMVVDDYALQNDSQPPLAFYDAQGDFDFALPEGAQLGQVSSTGPSGMPVNQGTINRGNGKYAIAYAFQPGNNDVRITYQVPYPSNKTTLRFVATHAAGRIGLIVPQTVQVESAGFTQQGQEQGFNLYSRDGVPAGSTFEVSISGTAPPPAADDGQSAAPAGGSSSSNIQVLPNRLDSLKWMLLGGFALLFSLGVINVWRKPVPAVAPIANASAALPVPSSRSARKKAAQAQVASPPKAVSAPLSDAAGHPSNGSSATAATGAASMAAVAAVEREVEDGLSGLKDKLFRLELRRQAGTISEDDYLRERSQTEMILRELVGR